MSVKIIYLNTTESLMIAQISAVNMYAESGNLVEITVFDGGWVDEGGWVYGCTRIKTKLK